MSTRTKYMTRSCCIPEDQRVRSILKVKFALPARTGITKELIIKLCESLFAHVTHLLHLEMHSGLHELVHGFKFTQGLRVGIWLLTCRPNNMSWWLHSVQNHLYASNRDVPKCVMSRVIWPWYAKLILANSQIFSVWNLNGRRIWHYPAAWTWSRHGNTCQWIASYITRTTQLGNHQNLWHNRQRKGISRDVIVPPRMQPSCYKLTPNSWCSRDICKRQAIPIKRLAHFVKDVFCCWIWRIRSLMRVAHMCSCGTHAGSAK